MNLKTYQERALYWLARYYERCRALAAAGDRFPVSTAFTSITGEIHNGTGLPYHQVPQLPGIPYVCLRVPTGGGKTMIACEAIPVAQRELLQADRTLILWLVPSEAIRSQTLARLKDKNDPYRISLETSLADVEVLDIDEAFNLQRATLDASTVIVVATMQAFRRKNVAQLKVYETSGALMSHFENLSPELLATLEKAADGTYEKSLANVFRLRRPFIIMDEAHNARQPLAFETLKRLNPSAILELTATPNTKRERVKWEGEEVENPPSNILYSVSAYALKAEDMVKLPIYLRYREPWDALLGDAKAFLQELTEEAGKEKAETDEFIRPIMLLQAQPKYQDKASITVEQVKARLLEFGVSEKEIAIATGEVRELDAIKDIAAPDCPVRYIITVQALKEGWDCPFAYILFSVAELSSATAVEQILGRIMRMPKAKRKQHEALNCSYAYVASSRFDEASRALKDGLVAAGFERQEAEDLIVPPELGLTPGGPVKGSQHHTAPKPLSIVLPRTPTLPVSVIDTVSYDEATKTLHIAKPLLPEQQVELLNALADKKSKVAVETALREQAALYRPLAPAELGVVFKVPWLALKQGEMFEPFESEQIEENLSWSLADADASLDSFYLPTQAKGIVIDISDEEKLTQNFIQDADKQRELLEVSTAWPVGQLVHWLDRSFAHADLTQAETGIYLTRLVEKLLSSGRFTLEQLTAHRYRLAKDVARKIKELRNDARQKVWQNLLFGELSGSVYVTDAASFVFDPQRYPYDERYHGLPLPKHYYEVIGNLANSGEEYQCAHVIAHLPEVEFWARNLDQQPNLSFWIQTSSDKFYPDFLVRLKNGKTIAIEYKGTHLADSADSREKEALGELWAARSNGACLFLMVKGPDELARVGKVVKEAMVG